MAPSWIPLCRSMQLYCEPYFASINNWRAYESEAILHNRLELVETVCQIFHVYSQNPDLHKFELICQKDVPLLEEVQPTAGRDYRVGGDQIAFQTASATQPKLLFQKAGVFFQDNLLKGIAGWSPEVLAGANIETRATIIAAIDKLFRIPEEAGIARFVYTHYPNTTAYVKHTVKEYATVLLSHKGDQFYRYIEASRKPGFDFDHDDTRAGLPEAAMVVAVDSKKKRARAADEKEDEWEADADGVMWTRKHHSVGSKVAAHFPPLEPQSNLVPSHDDQPVVTVPAGTISKLFKGKVTKYAPPSAPGLTDQLYHIRWEDGDEQDYDEVDIQRGMDLYDQLDGWTTRHAMVGIRVAAYFPVPVRVKGTNKTVDQQVLFCGSVTKFGRALSEDDVSLYHVVFDDGDEQDFSEHELKMGIELFNLEGIGGKKDKEKEKEREKEAKAAAKSSSVSAPTSAAKKQKTEKEARSLATILDEQPDTAVAVSAATASSRRSIHPDVAKSTSSKPAKEVKPTKAAVALFGAKSAKAHAASAAAAKKGASSKSPKKSPKKSDRKGSSIASTLDLLEEVGEEEGADDPVWTVHHASVFKRVAQHFEVPGSTKGKPKWEIYGGTVAVYAPPTAPGLRDQLYHVVWDDGDEQDYDEPELQAGLALLEGMMPTPLYVASAEAKRLVAAKQRAMASDYDFSTLSSSSSSALTKSSSNAADGASGASVSGSGSGSKAGTPAKSGKSDSVVVIDLEPNTTSSTSSSGAAAADKEVHDFTQEDDEAREGEEEIDAEGASESGSVNGSSSGSGNGGDSNHNSGGAVYDMTQVEGDNSDGDNSGGEESSLSGNVVTCDTAATIDSAEHHTTLTTHTTNEVTGSSAMDIDAWADTVEASELISALPVNTASSTTNATSSPDGGAQNAYNEHSTVADLFKNASNGTNSTHSNGAVVVGAGSTTSEMMVDDEEEEAA